MYVLASRQLQANDCNSPFLQQPIIVHKWLHNSLVVVGNYHHFSGVEARFMGYIAPSTVDIGTGSVVIREVVHV